jgi:hypothetical protein
MSKLVGFDRMWNAYPNPDGGADEAKRTIGGGANVSWITNTCTIRISRAFNYGGYPIPERSGDEITTVRGADGLAYAIRVREFVRWFRRKIGPPDLEYTYQPPGGDVPDTFRGHQGLIAFEVDGWTDATGHLDLWNGQSCRHAEYFNRASHVMLWEIANAPTGPALTASVGQGGTNRPPDVLLVQQLLRDRGEDPGPLDGVVGAKTIAAIRRFQSRFLVAPDGRVDPDGRTFRELRGL